jgi:hypothetical protein
MNFDYDENESEEDDVVQQQAQAAAMKYGSMQAKG